jgi:hypothetical protein
MTVSLPSLTEDRKAHTPGPWRVVTGEVSARYLVGIGDVVLIRRETVEDNRYVAMASLDAMGHDTGIRTSARERAANACLIAAAPELFAAVQFVLDHIADPERGPRDLYPAFGLDASRALEMCGAAIRKAQGE